MTKKKAAGATATVEEIKAAMMKNQGKRDPNLEQFRKDRTEMLKKRRITRAAVAPRQLNPAQLEIVYDHIETRPGITARRKRGPLATLRSPFLQDRRRSAPLLGSNFWRTFIESGGTELIGKNADTPQYLAA